MAKNENEIKIKVIEQPFWAKAAAAAEHTQNGKSVKMEEKKLKEHRFAGKFLDYSANVGWKEKLK